MTRQVNAERHNKIHSVECRYAECRFAECRGALLFTFNLRQVHNCNIMPVPLGKPPRENCTRRKKVFFSFNFFSHEKKYF